MEEKYVSIFVYKLKEECLESIKDRFPEILILNDEALCDATYLFVKESDFSKNKTSIVGSLLGAYNEVNSKNLISRNDINKMFSKLSQEIVELSVGDLGFLEGFGSVQLCVTQVVDENNIIVKPTSVNMFKPIHCLKSDFKLSKETETHIEYTYNLTVAIDCDIFPNTDKVDDTLLYYILKETLARILYNVHSIIDNINLVLLNPCPLLKMVGASLGVSSIRAKEINLPLLSDSSKAQIRVNPKKSYSILNVCDLKRLYTVSEKIDVHSLISLHKDLEVQTSLNPYEIYQLLNRRYFMYKSLLNINLKQNPLGDE